MTDEIKRRMIDALSRGLQNSNCPDCPIAVGTDNDGVIADYVHPHSDRDETTTYRIKIIPVDMLDNA